MLLLGYYIIRSLYAYGNTRKLQESRFIQHHFVKFTKNDHY